MKQTLLIGLLLLSIVLSACSTTLQPTEFSDLLAMNLNHKTATNNDRIGEAAPMRADGSVGEQALTQGRRIHVENNTLYQLRGNDLLIYSITDSTLQQNISFDDYPQEFIVTNDIIALVTTGYETRIGVSAYDYRPREEYVTLSTVHLINSSDGETIETIQTQGHIQKLQVYANKITVVIQELAWKDEHLHQPYLRVGERRVQPALFLPRPIESITYFHHLLQFDTTGALQESATYVFEGRPTLHLSANNLYIATAEQQWRSPQTRERFIRAILPHLDSRLQEEIRKVLGSTQESSAIQEVFITYYQEIQEQEDTQTYEEMMERIQEATRAYDKANLEETTLHQISLTGLEHRRSATIQGTIRELFEQEETVHIVTSNWIQDEQYHQEQTLTSRLRVIEQKTLPVSEYLFRVKDHNGLHYLFENEVHTPTRSINASAQNIFFVDNTIVLLGMSRYRNRGVEVSFVNENETETIQIGNEGSYSAALYSELVATRENILALPLQEQQTQEVVLINLETQEVEETITYHIARDIFPWRGSEHILHLEFIESGLLIVSEGRFEVHPIE